MSSAAFHQVLADLPRVGKLIKDRPYRQVWRFEHQGRAYYLKFYPRAGSFWKRLVRGNPAQREFRRLRWLEDANVPAPRAVAAVPGLELRGVTGDAVVLEAIEPAIPLAEAIDRALLEAEPLPDARSLALELRTLLNQLNLADLGHGDLHLGNFLLHGSRLFLLDAYAVRRGGLRMRDLMLLAHSAGRIASRTDLLRFWWMLGPGTRLPPTNPLRQRLCRKFVSKCTGENGYFGRLKAGDWSGHFYKRSPTPHRWSVLSRLEITTKDWEAAWPRLWEQIERDELPVIKRTRSGDVLRAEVVLAGRPVEVVLKRPRRKYWHRYINEVGRGARSRRAWKKAWSLAVRGLPVAWPLLLMERRRFGYVTDSIIVFEKVDGPTLATMNLDELPPPRRENLLRRAGRLLRDMERDGLYHWDAKAYNFIVQPDEKLGPRPVLVDVDGIRRFQYTRFALDRLLRSMRDNPSYTPADSRNLCLGYAPYAKGLKKVSDEATERRSDDGEAEG